MATFQKPLETTKQQATATACLLVHWLEDDPNGLIFPHLSQLQNHQPMAAVVPQGELQLSILESKPVDSLLLCWEVAFESGEGAVIWEAPVAEDLWILQTCCGHPRVKVVVGLVLVPAAKKRFRSVPTCNHGENCGEWGTKKLLSGVKMRPGAAIPKGKVKSLHHSTQGFLK